jgi:hypothetical protein
VAGGLGELGRAEGLVVGLAVERGVTTGWFDGEAVGAPGRCGSAPRRTPPAGVGTACAEGPLQALTPISEHTSAIPSRRRGAAARSPITAVACPRQAPRS